MTEMRGEVHMWRAKAEASTAAVVVASALLCLVAATLLVLVMSIEIGARPPAA